MLLDARSVDQFYRTRHGIVVARLLRERLSLFWPDLRGVRVLGLGHARPYLSLWHAEAACCLDVAPDTPAGGAWRRQGRSLTAVADGEMLPFADLTVDRILMVHGLEVAGNAQRLLRECWRVLRDDGRLLVVTPNRVGLWAHVETTPFGEGEPFTRGQVDRLLAGGLFAVERHDTALYLPPLGWKPLLRAAAMADRLGRAVSPRFAGVQILEAVKDVYAAVPNRPVTRRLVVPALVPMRRTAPRPALASLDPSRAACEEPLDVEPVVDRPGGPFRVRAAAR